MEWQLFLEPVIVAGLFHASLVALSKRPSIRHWFPPLVTGIVIHRYRFVSASQQVGIKYAAGGAFANFR